MSKTQVFEWAEDVARVVSSDYKIPIPTFQWKNRSNPDVDTSGFYDVGTKVIVLTPGTDAPQLLFSVLHELGHAIQDARFPDRYGAHHTVEFFETVFRLYSEFGILAEVLKSDWEYKRGMKVFRKLLGVGTHFPQKFCVVTSPGVYEFSHQANISVSMNPIGG